ncbi:hypothetical protein [Sagittula sp. S175]|uniref:hypothetical protein n=1 Tax=Sagittula sp. S175 TaxID=3415129 RepID=UPI003C7B940C
MPITLAVHNDHALAYFRMTGITTVTEAANSLRAWVSHPSFNPDFTMLVNMGSAEKVEATFLGTVFAAERLTTALRAFRPRGHCILYAPDDIAFGTARMVQQIVEPMSSICFDLHRTERKSLAVAGLSFTSFSQLDSALGVLAPAA